MGEQPEHGEVRIGFYGVANRVRKRAEGAVEAAVGGFDTGAAVDVGRSANGGGDFFERHGFAAEGLTVRIGPARGTISEMGGVGDGIGHEMRDSKAWRRG